MRVYGTSRRALFERLDQPALRPLLTEHFVYGDWTHCGVNVDYQVVVDHHYYSVPHALCRQRVEARYSALTVEVFHNGERVASHRRRYERGRHTTTTAHMPKAHQQYLEWAPSRIVGWAQQVGPKTAALVAAILEERRHPEQGYRSCLGILRLGKRYGDERLEAACARSLAVSARSYRHIDFLCETTR